MNTTEILFPGKYINGKALDKLYDFSENKYITKTNPGIGVTTALFNYTLGNLIVISPLSPMITKKAQAKNLYESHQQFFTCTDYKTPWSVVEDYLDETPTNQQNLIINCTPDSICHIYDNNPKLFRKLQMFNVVVDEYDTVIMQSELRPVCGRFLELLFNKWNNTYALTTATPNYDNIDIPIGLKIYRVGQQAHSTIELQYSENYKDCFNFIHTEIKKGNKVACFTNNLNIHKGKFDPLQKSMAGENLTLKLEYYNVDTGDSSDKNLYENSNVIVFSGRYFNGYDIPEDVSVVILSEANHTATCIGVNAAVQALHRCRGTIKNSLFINARLNKNIKPTINHIAEVKKNHSVKLQFYNNLAKEYTASWTVLDDEPITPELYANRALLSYTSLSKIYHYELHMRNFLKERFGEYNVQLKDYITTNIVEEKPNRVKFNERIRNVIKDNIGEMESNYIKVKNQLKYDNQGSHNTDRGMERLTALLIKLIDNKNLYTKLDNKNLRPAVFYEYFDKYLQRNHPCKHLTECYRKSIKCLSQIEESNNSAVHSLNEEYITDWYLFYAAFKVKRLKLPEKMIRYLKIRDTASNSKILEEFKVDIKNRHQLAFRKVSAILKPELGKLSASESKKIKTIIQEGYKNDRDKKFTRNQIKANKTNIINAIYYFINPSIEVTNKHYRQYNPLTRFPKIFREVLPFDYVSVDIESANPQFVDKILNSENQTNVYHNIMVNLKKLKNQEHTRDEVKKIYNYTLNNHRVNSKVAIDFYQNICGYTIEQSIKLASMTCDVKKGSFFERMSDKEDLIIKEYQKYFNFKGIRLHDSIVLAPWHINKPIPLEVNNIRFNVSYFRTGTPYDEITI